MLNQIIIHIYGQTLFLFIMGRTEVPKGEDGSDKVILMGVHAPLFHRYCGRGKMSALYRKLTEFRRCPISPFPPIVLSWKAMAHSSGPLYCVIVRVMRVPIAQRSSVLVVYREWSGGQSCVACHWSVLRKDDYMHMQIVQNLR